MINKHQSGERELWDDRACSFAYAAIAISLNVPERLRRFLSYKQENHGLARWMTSATGYFLIYTHKFVFSLSQKQTRCLNTVCRFAVGVFAPAWVTVFLKPSAVSGPENVLLIRDLLLSMDNTCKKVIERSVNPTLRGRIAFSPQRNMEWTRDQSVNSSFAVVVQ